MISLLAYRYLVGLLPFIQEKYSCSRNTLSITHTIVDNSERSMSVYPPLY